MKQASAYLRDNLVLMHPYSQTTQGFWISAPPFVVESFVAAPADVLGRRLREVLEASSTGIPHPENWEDVPWPLPQLAGVKTANAFEKGSRSFSVDRDEKSVIFRPAENRRRNGFVPLQELEFEIPITATDEEIGQALMKAFELSR